MNLNKKIAIPLSILALSVAGASWFYKSGTFSKQTELHKADGARHQEQSAPPLYTCPMHPFIIKDAPGTCPICAMELVKKVTGAADTTALTPEQQQEMARLGQIALSPTQRVMANVAVQEARVQELTREITAVGLVQYDQSRQAKVTAWIAGRIDALHVNTVGSQVSRDRPVAELYSPDLLATQQEYLLAVKSRDRLKNSPIPAVAQNGEGLVAAARQRLMLFGVKEQQIAELEKAGTPTIKLPIYTPLSGVVVEKMVQQGQYVNVGDVLFNVADLSRVWVEIEVYESEFRNIRIGQAVEIRSQSFPGRGFSGRVAFIYPFLDPKTRTVKARVELPNPGMLLKPDMFVNAVLKVGAGAAVTVPVTAVMDSGKQQTVWVEIRPGVFEPRMVQVGQRTDALVQILSGVRAGEKVAVSGAYLIDSESKLRGGAAEDHSQHTGGAQPEGKVPAVPQQPAPGKKPLNMDDMKM
ncbi:efflux RND transporter periplasmic adaptor subunit [Trichlorobacter ammonificans]|uniref:Co/Zn/Cd efflux system membrane fusion protein n=1 Tax=Trichlorobacter ammonificans TaxID=2916410 RepID=A0ABM9D5C5_9BACT|nr:efflux RND transporter periplasmic adaptor subunit [Trichlorobacter ammonificans]CAH2030401.1 putative Co/Zn/Cd efflux system membrane fusion protein [Trichlorobacter ammonificans]